MGMTSYGLGPGTRFDLRFSFGVGGALQSGEIREIRCAEDTIPE
jgi:hypothetical protein